MRDLGFELSLYSPETSRVAQMKLLFACHKINLALDVGANTGGYARFLREFGYKGKIISFEPLASAHAQLKTTSKNDSLWEVAPRTAIGNTKGVVNINVSANSSSSSVLDILDTHINAAPQSAYIGTETVDIHRIDDIASKYINESSNSIFLKVDVQGFEAQVLEGANNILSMVEGIQLELSFIPLYKGQILFSEMVSNMHELGYELHALLPVFVDPILGRMLQMDGIFFRKN